MTDIFKNEKLEYDKIFEYDKLQIFFGDDYYINDKLIIKQPKIQDIVTFGEKKFYNMLYTITSIPSDMKSELFDSGIDYQTISDFYFFIMMTRSMTVDDTKLLFGDLDLSKMQIKKKDDDSYYLVDFEKEIVIDELLYMRIIGYIRAMFDIYPKVEKAKNKRTFEILILDDRQRKQANAKKEYSSFLLPLISSMLCSSGFKYNKDELRNVGIVEFMDAVKRISTIVSTTALLHGMYSGFVDTSKIKDKQFNWLRDLDEEGHEHKGAMTVQKSS